MRKEKILKTITFFTIVIVIIFSNSVSNAVNIKKQLGENLSNYAKIQTESKTFNNKVSTVLEIISAVGTIVSIIALILIGIKYMMGSIEEKVEYKKTLKPYIIGTLMVFAITNFLSIFYQVFSNIF